MELRLLGAVELSEQGRVVNLGGPKQRLLLAVLLAHRGRVVSIHALTEALWGDAPPDTARTTVQTAVSKLRRQLQGDQTAVLLARPPGYVLQLEGSSIDADRFEQGLATARSLLAPDPTAAERAASEALAEWRGNAALAEFADNPLVAAEARRLEELRLQAIELRCCARLALGDAAAVIAELKALTPLEPLREELWTLLSRGLAAAGRQTEALRVLAAFRRHLRDESGLEPSARFVEVEREVLDRELPVAAPRLESPAASAGIIGRDATIAEVCQAMADGRWVTLTGTGGVGKSTVAVEVARQLADRFRHGVRFVELAPVAGDVAAAAAIAQAVNAERRSERSLLESIAEVLGPQEVLLVLDNCEHVLERVGEIIRHLLRWCPGVRILATSREAIGLPGEMVRALVPLAVPADPTVSFAEIATAPAVEVFVARAREVAPGFVLTETTAAIVAEICIQLDGLPLALELAAARMSALTPRELADRLHQRFALLGSGPGRAARHRSLIDVVQWSYALLDPVERLTFARLSVFAGGFDLDAAEHVAGVAGLDSTLIAPVLTSLVDKSLVTAQRNGDHMRYSVLETLRHFGAARLAEQTDATEVLLAHIATYRQRALSAAAGLDGPDEATWAALVDRDTGNLRAAFQSAVAVGDADAALTLVTSLREFAFRHIRYEFIEWAERALAMDGAQEHGLMPVALATVAHGAFVRGELHRAVGLATEARTQLERLDVRSCGLTERTLGNAHFYLGQRQVGLDWIVRLAGVASGTGEHARAAHGLYMCSVAHTSIGDHAAGNAYADRALLEAEASGSATAFAHAYYARGFALTETAPDEAISCFELSATRADSVGNRWMRSFARTELYWLRAKRGETEVALEGYRELIATWFRGGEWANQWLSLRQLAGILGRLGQDTDAALLFGAIDAAGATSALPLSPAEASELGAESRAMLDRLGEDEFRTLTAKGASMREDAAVDFALQAISRALSGLRT